MQGRPGLPKWRCPAGGELLRRAAATYCHHMLQAPRCAALRCACYGALPHAAHLRRAAWPQTLRGTPFPPPRSPAGGLRVGELMCRAGTAGQLVCLPLAVPARLRDSPAPPVMDQPPSARQLPPFRSQARRPPATPISHPHPPPSHYNTPPHITPRHPYSTHPTHAHRPPPPAAAGSCAPAAALE